MTSEDWEENITVWVKIDQVYFTRYVTWHRLLIFIKSRVPFLSCDIKIISVSRQSCSTLCDSMDCSLPSSSVHGISQARTLEWIAIPFSRESSWSRNQTQVSCIVGQFFTIWAPSYFLFLSPKTIDGVKREGVCICGEGEPWVPEKGVRAKVGWGGHPPTEGVGASWHGLLGVQTAGVGSHSTCEVRAVWDEQSDP